MGLDVDLAVLAGSESTQDYCGCCGNPCGPGRMWCVRCTRTVGHLGPADRPAWDRTHQATHGEPCPFQVGRVAA